MLLAAASSAVRPVLAGPARPAECLGVTPGALYLKIARPPGALALLSHDAVRLPCGLLLPTTSAELPLTSLAPPSHDASAGFVVGDGAVGWTGPAGPVVVRAVREWAPARSGRGEVAASALAAVRTVLNGAGLRGAALASADPGVDLRLLTELAAAASDRDASLGVAARLLGIGPGLTPSGDDVLAGFLAGAAAFGLDVAALREAIAVLAPAGTTALSAALLWHAARGECIDEVAAVAALLTSHRGIAPEQAGRSVGRLRSVGHTSGAALALGLVTAAESALHVQAVQAKAGLTGTGLTGTAPAATGPATGGRAA
jgi:Protein of unknown function (DUF2877)